MKIKRFSKKDRESSEREFLRRRSDKNAKTSSYVSMPASLAGFYGTGGALSYLTRNSPSAEKAGPLILGTSLLSGISAGYLSDKVTKLGLDSRDYLRAKRLTDEELKKENDKLKEKQDKTPKGQKG